MPNVRAVSEGSRSTLSYTPQTSMDYGTLLCLGKLCVVVCILLYLVVFRCVWLFFVVWGCTLSYTPQTSMDYGTLLCLGEYCVVVCICYIWLYLAYLRYNIHLYGIYGTHMVWYTYMVWYIWYGTFLCLDEYFVCVRIFLCLIVFCNVWSYLVMFGYI